ncbi:hypothetical protein FBQ82_04995 [Anaerolineae bacterium CFX7]|nr:hypothetical protein [Anaerolineae bacterium CFX7]
MDTVLALPILCLLGLAGFAVIVGVIIGSYFEFWVISEKRSRNEQLARWQRLSFYLFPTIGVCLVLWISTTLATSGLGYIQTLLNDTLPPVTRTSTQVVIAIPSQHAPTQKSPTTITFQQTDTSFPFPTVTTVTRPSVTPIKIPTATSVTIPTVEPTPTPTPTPTPRPPTPNFASLINQHTQECLTVLGNSVVQARCTQNANQLWQVRTGNGSFKMVSESGLCLSFSDIDVVVSDCNGSPAWALRQWGDYNTIENIRRGMGKSPHGGPNHPRPAILEYGIYFQIMDGGNCVDVDEWNHDQGGRIIYWPCNGTNGDNANQLWAFYK